MSDDDDLIPLDQCTLPGTIRVTERALDLAKQFQTAVPAGWIASFSWHDGERFRANKDAPWVDNGPGLGLGAYRNSEIPEEAVYRSGRFRYAVLIRQDIVESHAMKTIDLDGAGKVVFT